MSTYAIADDFSSITCALCGLVSHNHDDIRDCYCANCKRFHQDWGDAVPYESFIRLLACVQAVMKKRRTGDPSMPWESLDVLCLSTLEAVMGDVAYQRWQRSTLPLGGDHADDV
jgi:hypothetical protein